MKQDERGKSLYLKGKKVYLTELHLVFLQCNSHCRIELHQYGTCVVSSKFNADVLLELHRWYSALLRSFWNYTNGTVLC